MEILKFLAQEAHILETEKFVSTKDAKANPGMETTGSKAAWDLIQGVMTFTEENLAFAQEALDFVRGYTGTNKYLVSLAKSAAFDDIGVGQADRVAWVIPAYLRNAEESLPGNLGAESKFVGSEGSEAAFIGTVAKTRTYVRFGKQKQVISLLDEKGNVYVWFPSNKVLPVEAGDCVKVVATVKAHNTYNGVNQTILTRATLTPFVRR
jgi:hypothetical protein